MVQLSDARPEKRAEPLRAEGRCRAHQESVILKSGLSSPKARLVAMKILSKRSRPILCPPVPAFAATACPLRKRRAWSTGDRVTAEPTATALALCDVVRTWAGF